VCDTIETGDERENLETATEIVMIRKAAKVCDTIERAAENDTIEAAAE